MSKLKWARSEQKTHLLTKVSKIAHSSEFFAHCSLKWAKLLTSALSEQILLTSACSLAPDGSWLARHQWWKFYHESDTVNFPYQVSPGPHQRPSQKTFATPPSSIHRHHGSSGELNMVKDRHFSTNRLETCFILSGASHLPCLLFTVLIHHVLMKQRGPFGCQRRHGGVQHHRMDYVSFFLFGLPCEKSHVETLVGFYNGFFGNPILPSFSWPTSIFVETLVGFYSPSPKPPWRTTARYSEILRVLGVHAYAGGTRSMTNIYQELHDKRLILFGKDPGVWLPDSL